jgi:hypothetical protein
MRIGFHAHERTMSLEYLRRRLEEFKRKRTGNPTNLQYLVHRQTLCPMAHIYVPDPLMDLPALEEVKTFLKLDKTNELPFETDRWDCDNYAAVLRTKAMLYSKSIGKNWAFGECESNKYGDHRFNLVAVEPSAYVYYIEPQNDVIFTQPGQFKFILF